MTTKVALEDFDAYLAAQTKAPKNPRVHSAASVLHRPVPDGVPEGSLESLSPLEYASIMLAHTRVHLIRKDRGTFERVQIDAKATELVQRYVDAGWTVEARPRA